MKTKHRTEFRAREHQGRQLGGGGTEHPGQGQASVPEAQERRAWPGSTVQVRTKLLQAACVPAVAGCSPGFWGTRPRSVREPNAAKAALGTGLGVGRAVTTRSAAVGGGAGQQAPGFRGVLRRRLTDAPPPACTPASPWRRAPGSPRARSPRAPSPTSGAAVGGRSTRVRSSAPAEGAGRVRGRSLGHASLPHTCTRVRAQTHTHTHRHCPGNPRLAQPECCLRRRGRWPSPLP